MIFQKIDNYRVVAKKNSWEAEIKISCCNKLVLRRPVYKLSLFFVSSSGKKRENSNMDAFNVFASEPKME
jgi:hypothetical protein